MLRTALLLCLVGCAVEDLASTEAPLVIGPAKPPPQGRASIWGFVPGTETASRFWLDHGPNELPELTGPNDRQLVGNFMGTGHDQVLFLNYWGGTRRVVIADFWANTTTPTLDYEEPWGNSSLNGWDDRQEWHANGIGDTYADDVALVGDFLRLGHDQLLLLNRQPTGGRMKIVSYATHYPVTVYTEDWGGPGIPDQFSGAYDDLIAGDFMGDGYDQLMLVNTDDVWPGAPRVLVRDFSAGSNQYADVYSDQYGSNYAADLRPRPVTKRFAGDFLGLGHDQVLYLNPTGVGTRIWIHDYANGLSTPWWENYADSVLLNGWHDDNDWISVGDFAGNQRDQLLFMNRDGINGRVMLVDFTIGQLARSLRTDSWSAPSPLNGWQDDNDLYMAGRFTPASSAGLLTFNNFFIGARQDYRFVTTADEAIALLGSHYTGIIDFDSTRSFDFTWHAELTVRSGITMRGGRAGLNLGALLHRNDLSSATLFEVRGSDVAIENLRLRGSAAGRRDSYLPHQGGIGILVQPAAGLGKNVRVSGCELDEWLGKAIVVSGWWAISKKYVEEVDKGWPRQGKHNAHWVQVTNNFIHHNVRDGAGYGVLIEGGAYATIERNVFDYNRHAISGSGFTHSGFIARYNFVQEGGFPQAGGWHGGFYNQHFDMHGVGDDGRGGPAGEYMDVSYNTFRGEQQYYYGKTRPAFMVRGTPSDVALVYQNVWVHDSGEAVRLDDGDADWPIVDDEEINHVVVSNDNRWSTDYVADLGTGDFDGDGTADVFVGTGTSWWYSSGGVTEWRFLNAARETASQLAFANLDGDLKTDVIWFDPATYQVLYSSGGTGPWTYVTISPQPLSQLRFADFNGDGYSDIFRTYEWKWWIMDGKTKQWAYVNSASNPIHELRFGQFDDVLGDDVVGVVGSQWMRSSSARSYWQPLNSALLSSLASTVAGDFVGTDGKTDIAYRSGSRWVVSSGGRTAFTDLRVLPGTSADHHPNLTGLMFGNFDRSDTTIEAVTFERRYWNDPERGGYAYHPGPYLKRWSGSGASSFIYVSNRPMM